MITRTLKHSLLAGLTAAFLIGTGSSFSQTPAPGATPAGGAPALQAQAAPKTLPKDPKDLLNERVAALEAYLTNSDPSVPFNDYKITAKDGSKSLPTKETGASDAQLSALISTGTSGPGHNAWMMTSAALVLFMTLPGLALFYGGLVRKKNVLSVVAQCFGIAGLVTILWVVCGYSLVFHKGTPFLGNLGFAFFKDVTSAPNTDYSYWVSQNVYAMYQLMFAIITPALIVGAIAERMKFSAIILFVTLWMFAVYFPLAHMVWGIDGWMNGVWNPAAKVKAIDFAGGTVVHMSSGWSALILCMILGKRQGWGKMHMAPHSMVLCAVGTGMLWVGWYGFNAGSAVGADGIAANAFTTTTVATATACFVWPLLEYIKGGKPSILGFCSGAVAGLVVITPACGFVDVKGALIIGVVAAAVPYFFCTVVKKMFGYDDALDTFGVHAVGGTIGAFLTGVLATANSGNGNIVSNLAAVGGEAHRADANAATQNGLIDLIGHGLWMEQLKAMAFTIVLAVSATIVIAFIVKVVVGLRPRAEVEDIGLDTGEHGEAGYEM